MEPGQRGPHRVAVLVVENDAEIVEDDQRELTALGYRPVIALGRGQRVIDLAVALAVRNRCMIALVDMRLVDDADSADQSGMDVIKLLGHTLCIVRTAHGTGARYTALRAHGAFDFLEKGGDPLQLRRSLEEARQHACPCGQRARLHWHRSDGIVDTQRPALTPLAGWVASNQVAALIPAIEQTLQAIISWDWGSSNGPTPLLELYELALPRAGSHARTSLPVAGGPRLLAPEPLSWLAAARESEQIPAAPARLCHRGLGAPGELGVDEQGRLWFGQAHSAGLHHRAYDVATLELALLLALAPADEALPPEWYELLVALLAPERAETALRLSRRIAHAPAARQALLAVNALRAAARELRLIDGPHEYLWALLLVAAERLTAEPKGGPPLVRALAGMACDRLDAWGRPWPRAIWPDPGWLEEAGGEQALQELFAGIRTGESRVFAGLPALTRRRLLRQFLLPQHFQQRYLGPQAETTLLVPVDCDRLAGWSDLHLYELMLTALAEAATQHPTIGAHAQALNRLSEEAIQTDRVLMAQRHLERAIAALCQSPNLSLCFLLDRFDELYRSLSDQALKTLSAIHDRHWGQVCYLLGMQDERERIAPERVNAAFEALFGAPTYWLPPDGPVEAREELARLRRRNRQRHATLSEPALLLLSGYQRGLLAAIFNAALYTPAPVEREALEAWASALPAVQQECRRIWASLAHDEQLLLCALARGEPADDPDLRERLVRKGVLVRRVWADAVGEAGASGPDGEAVDCFSPLFRAHAARSEARERIVRRQDGRYYCGARDLDILGATERPMMDHLYKHAGEVCTNEAINRAIAEANGERYQGQRDLNTLARRLRKKIQPGLGPHHYLQTIDGIGYRLVGTDRYADFI